MNQTSPVALPPTKLVVEGLRPSDLLPLELVNRILEYDGRIKYRHGKYMNQIAQDDDRYKILLTVPKIETYNHHYLCMTITGNGNKIYCEKNVSGYLLKELIMINIYSDTGKVSYCYKNQGFHYIFIIYKTPPLPTSFIELFLQKWYDLCRKII
jgi:hypothetical protein